MPIEQLVELLKTGGLTGLLALALFAIYKLNQELIGCKKNLVEAWKEVGKILQEQNGVMANWVSSNEARTRALEATGRAQEISAVAQAALTQKIEELSQLARKAIDSNQEMRESLIQRGAEFDLRYRKPLSEDK